MSKITITIVDESGKTLAFERDSEMLESTVQGTTLQWSVFDMTPQAFVHILDKGANRGVNDYANQKGKDATAEQKLTHGRERVADYQKADWFPGSRDGDSDPMAVHRRTVLRAWLTLPDYAAQAKEHKKAKGEDKPAYLDTWYESLSKAKRAKVDKLAESAKARAEQAAAEKKALTKALAAAAAKE